MNGNILNRATITEALKTQRRTVSVEFGIQHNFTLHNVHPWFIDSKLTGFIGMGEEIDHILPGVAKMLGSEIFVTSNKKLLSREKWEKGIALYGNNTKWAILEESVLIGKTMDRIPVGLETYLNRQDETDKVLFKFQEQDKKYIGGFVNLEDVKNENVGKLVILKDVTVQRQTVNNYILLILIAGTILFLLVMGIVVKYVNMINRNLDYYHRQLEDAAYVDTLTGIGNRRFLQEKAEGFFAGKQSGVIIQIDIDNFKQLNDKYGHDIGDDVLKTLSKKVSDYIRQDDIFARYGGEEFIILLPRCELDIAMIKAEAIRHALESTRTTTTSGPLQITVSMGVHEIQKEDSFDDAIKYSDIALLQAKENGRNCIEVYR